MNTAYGFDADKWEDDPARQAQGSDYAKCQGLYVSPSNGYSRWWLRLAGYYSDHARGIDLDGCVFDRYNGTGNANFGVRPALQLNLTSEIVQSDVSEVGSDVIRPGDADDDGEVTLRDVAMISRWLVGGWNVTINEIDANVNQDGVVDLKDVVLIRRFLAGGWDVTLQ